MSGRSPFEGLPCWAFGSAISWMERADADQRLDDLGVKHGEIEEGHLGAYIDVPRSRTR